MVVLAMPPPTAARKSFGDRSGLGAVGMTDFKDSRSNIRIHYYLDKTSAIKNYVEIEILHLRTIRFSDCLLPEIRDTPA